jgi:acetoin utilization deacetylase AcuC-like enzyme
VDRTLGSAGGTLQAARDAYSRGDGFGAQLAGGTHHAFYDRGEGFCVLNDIAIASNVLLYENSGLQRILVVDLDVHQGNGTARMFRHDDRVFTLSAHCTSNIFSTLEQVCFMPQGCISAEELSFRCLRLTHFRCLN